MTVKLSNVSTLARYLLYEHHDLDYCLERLGAAREGDGRRGLRRLLRGVLDGGQRRRRRASLLITRRRGRRFCMGDRVASWQIRARDFAVEARDFAVEAMGPPPVGGYVMDRRE